MLEDRVSADEMGRVFSEKENVREIYWFAIDLLDSRKGYDVNKLFDYAMIHGHEARLGYLLDISLEAAEEYGSNRGYCGHVDELRELRDKLKREIKEDREWGYMMEEAGTPIKQFWRNNISNINEKWSTYSGSVPLDISDYIELYLRRKDE